jgi:hypothetical protein
MALHLPVSIFAVMVVKMIMTMMMMMIIIIIIIIIIVKLSVLFDAEALEGMRLAF